MKQLQGQFIFSRSTDTAPVTLTFPDGWINGDPVICDVKGAIFKLPIADISPAEGAKRRRISFVGGHKVYVQATDFPAFLEKGKWQKRLELAERGPWYMLALYGVLTAVILWAGTVYLLPRLADSITRYIPDEVVANLSRSTLSTLDNWVLEPSHLSENEQTALQDAFRAFQEEAGISPEIPLLFRRSELLGANAFALPDGPVVILDELVALAPSEEGVMGVLAHEAAHIYHQHNRRNLARSGLFSLLNLAFGFSQFGDNSALLAENLVFSGYSREFEVEADKTARQWLLAQNYDLTAFDEMLEALYHQHCEEPCPDKPTGLFDTHPSLADRLAIEPH